MSALYVKLAAARAAMTDVVKSKTADVGTYTYAYAELGSVMAAVDKACASAGLQWVQVTNVDGDRWTLDTVVIDAESGETVTLSGAPGAVKGDPQAMGSAITYYRRYSLCIAFGLNVHDDDGAQAHRAIADPLNRTPAETETRALITAMDADDRKLFLADFADEFGSGLKELPESRHGDALAYTKFWDAPPRPPITNNETSN